MLENVVKQEIILYVMAVLVGVGVLAKMISAITVRRIVKEASEIHKSNHRLMKLLKAKFEHASMISDRVQNVNAFVDKFVYEYKVMGIRLDSWRVLPKKMLLIVGVLGVFAIFESFRMEGIGKLTQSYLQWTGLFVMFLALLYFFAEEKSRIAAAKNYMVEYFENVCVSRYIKKHREAEENVQTEEEVPEELVVAESLQETDVLEEQKQEEKKKNEQEMRIRAILEEFLA